MNNEEALLETNRELKELIEKGFGEEDQSRLDELFSKQMKNLQNLDINNEEHRALMEKALETNKELMKIVAKKKEEIIEQVGKMADTQENKKNYDLYK